MDATKNHKGIEQEAYNKSMNQKKQNSKQTHGNLIRIKIIYHTRISSNNLILQTILPLHEESDHLFKSPFSPQNHVNGFQLSQRYSSCSGNIPQQMI